jgi:hypothetical protein
MRNAICFAATEDFMVLRHAVIPSYRSSVQLKLAATPAADVAPAGGVAEQSQWGNSLHEHHHGHDERAEAGI